ncbi:uncharacterized protein VP01_123g4 [Puccinia sorghi]|uniref:Uncharacterized protein n=1 Tax=Puccinia sorghi TaxID=27349 RepID=A0A0L6VPM3_9BASI|nr:uncharacterized protein VP01_123g4 [Puccinia sorghi]
MKACSSRQKPSLWIGLTLTAVYLLTRYINRTSVANHNSNNYDYHSRQSRYQGPTKSKPKDQSQISYYHARETARRLIPYSPDSPSWRKTHQDELVRLLGCHQSDAHHPSCTPKDQNISQSKFGPSPRHIYSLAHHLTHLTVLLGTVHFSRVLDGIFNKKAEFPAGEAICKCLFKLSRKKKHPKFSWESFTQLFLVYVLQLAEISGADAFLWALNQLEYPYLVVDGVDHNETNTRLGEIHSLLGSSVNMVIGDYLSIPQCFKNNACVESKLNANGIPHHKLFVFDGKSPPITKKIPPGFFSLNCTRIYGFAMFTLLKKDWRTRLIGHFSFCRDIGHPLGRKWHLTFYPRKQMSHPVSTEEEKNFTYLGLTIEHYCHKFGVVPPKERSNKVYILGKDRGYLHPPSPTLYPESMWASITNATGIGFTIGTRQKHWSTIEARTAKPKDRLLEGIEDIGSLSRDRFIYELQHHKAVIGLGWPVQPSTPLEALCVGTPFINPVWLGRRTQPDRSKWHTQHPYLATDAACPCGRTTIRRRNLTRRTCITCKIIVQTTSRRRSNSCSRLRLKNPSSPTT